LAGKKTVGVLSAEEHAELESLVRANFILSILKAGASAFLYQTRLPDGGSADRSGP
jgi:hypothetical protein